MTHDLSWEAVAASVGERPVRVYPALLSTEVSAMAWARNGASAGAVVVADYQASPRGRGGLPWRVRPGRGLGFSLVVRPDLPPEREGWPYVAASLAISRALGDAAVEWPDAVAASDTGQPIARLGVYVELGPAHAEWATLTVHVEDAGPPRAPLLGHLLDALERCLAEEPESVLTDYRGRCLTLGRQVRARMIPMGSGGPEINGEAVDVLPDGALVVLTPRGSRVAVPPQNLGLLEAPETPPVVPQDVQRVLEDQRRQGNHQVGGMESSDGAESGP